MYVHLANASTVVLCYMSCMFIYLFLNVCVVTVFMSAKSSTELMFVMLHCKPNPNRVTMFSLVNFDHFHMNIHYIFPLYFEPRENIILHM
jgi:hypothetical protein